uniref:ankyrin repeat-containing protein At5g02620-like isoform X2 n=1 Tax=Erigeron canadensis TaxID=72917 RepID=UPI001CB9854D|nr:ankyrin repeat-containing protein At5g02620-like isoform X2 [Erigeron canadensis]
MKQPTTAGHVQLPPIDEETPVNRPQQDQVIVQVPALAQGRPPQPNLPHSELLLEGRREDYIKVGIPLYEASIKGDWQTAHDILKGNPDLVKWSITENCETALHVAASAKQTKQMEDFVKNLVKMMAKEDLELQNNSFNTALCLAAAAGNVEMVKILVEKNPALLTIPGSQQMMPLYMAALFGQRDVVYYLYGRSKGLRDDGWNNQNRGWLLLKCVEADLFDIALQILEERPELASNGSVLGVLAKKPDAFSRKSSNIFRRTLNKGSSGTIKRAPSMGNARKTYSSRILFVAAEMGNTKFIVELIRKYPDLIWKVNDNNQSIFHIAVKHRHEGIYNLLYEIGSMKDLITPLKDDNDNNMLHLVGKSAKKKRLQDVSGVALQMQRELLWFKEVESMIPPSYRERKNKDGLTPYELFTKEHKDLVAQGEKWMKGTSSQCMVVAALIATIVFAAAFTVPGGYIQDTNSKDNGIPVFHSKVTFMVFVVADAISLFSSSASILMFLSILTSRYAERDFLQSLPKKLMIGLFTLFLSITSMTVAFSVSFFVLYKNGLVWMPIVISMFAVLPVFLFAWLQYPLLADVRRSTYGSRYLFKPSRLVLYYEDHKLKPFLKGLCLKVKPFFKGLFSKLKR